MMKARRTEGPRAPLFFSALPILILGSLADAQSVDLSDLEICAGLESAELKLACFEAITATGKRSVGSAPQPQAQMAAEFPQAGESAATVPTPDPELPPETDSVAIAATNVDAVTTDDDLGREHLERAVESESVATRFTVTEVTQSRNRGLSFHLANGQIWRQIEPRYFPYPKGGEFDVTISTGIMGEYRLRIGDDGRMVRVRRVK